MQPLLLVVAWALVLAPLSWGVARSVQRSMPLFTAGSPAPTVKPPGSPTGAGTTAPTKP